MANEEVGKVVVAGAGNAGAVQVYVPNDALDNMPIIYHCMGTEDSLSLSDIIADSLDGVQMTLFDLDIVKVPGGGTTSFDIEDADKSKIEGIILNILDMRSYWEKESGDDDGAMNSPPDCSSYGGVVGYGNPGGKCATCQHAAFGSGKNGGQKCKHMKLVFIAKEGSFLPVAIKFPPTSLNAVKAYTLSMIKAGKKRDDYSCVFSLKKIDKTKTTPAYSVIEISEGKKIPSTYTAAVKTAKDQTAKFIDVMIEETLKSRQNPEGEDAIEVVDNGATEGFDFIGTNAALSEEESSAPIEDPTETAK